MLEKGISMRSIVSRGASLALMLIVGGVSGATVGWAATGADGTRPVPVKLPSFFPVAESVELQRRCGVTGPDNAILTATLDEKGMATLRQVNGRADLAAIGQGKVQLVLRDDGQGLDRRAGDGTFTALTTVDLGEVLRRAYLEESLERKGRLDRVARFEGREMKGFTRLTAMSSRDFLNCQPVSIQPMPVTNTVNAFNEDFFWTTILTLFITQADPIFASLAIDDPDRTYNPCTNGGNPDGVWTFAHFMRQMAMGSGLTPEQFTRDWIDLYTEDQTSAATNGFTVPDTGYGADNFINDWPKQADGVTLDLDRAPFRLLAIVPRLDLRPTPSGTTGPYGGTGASDHAGELRFIFGAMRDCIKLDFTVIFEYGVPLTACHDIRQWARDWLGLTELALGDDASDEDYRQALEDLTTQITSAGSDPDKPNGNALNQLRTNELSLNGNNWFIREFHLTSGGLIQATTANAPDRSFKNTPDGYPFFDALVSDPTIPEVPLQMTANGATENFLGAQGIVAFPHPAPAWGSTSDLDYSDPDVADERHRRGLSTCDGCHSNETGTPKAHMLHPVTDTLSPFLVGTDFPDDEAPQVHPDPVTGEPRQFYDLLRRFNDINSLANSLCGSGVAFDDLMHEELADEG